ncbi:MAG: glycosyltransferase family 4 protein [Steroidobacteraceae bacterium]
MRILFTFENPLPNDQADAEVFMTTAKYLAPLATQSCIHVPAPDSAGCAAAAALAAMPVVRAYAPARPAALRHLFCGLTLPLRREFRDADLVYTRNLWVAWLAVLFGQRVVFDHYRPWPDQIPPLQLWLHRLICNRRFVVNICHSEYTRNRYLDLGIPAAKLHCVHNGFEPQHLRDPVPLAAAKLQIGIAVDRKTVVYTGRINHKKGLDLVIEAAHRLPGLEFILVGSSGDGGVEAAAKTVGNVRLIPWQAPEALARYLFAADVLVIPPSRQPLAAFGSTVLPLKTFLYMGSGRPIVAGDTPDVREVLRHGENALLCRPDDPDSLVAAIRAVTSDARLAERLAAAALADSRDHTWSRRAQRIAAIVTERLESAPVEPGVWSRTHFRSWLGQSWRWAAHFVRNRSWVLPPKAVRAAAPLRPAEHE